jgi:hypothetical protein
MRRAQSPIGVSLIYIGSALLTLNLLAWLLFGAPLGLAASFLALWATGIVIAAIEPSCGQPQRR